MKSRIDFFTLIAIFTAVFITVAGIVFKQNFERMLPLYVSLIIILFQSRVSRAASLIGSVNSLFYAAVYLNYGLYTTAAYAAFVSCPIQAATFINWSKRPYGKSVRLKKMTLNGKIITAVIFIAVWMVLIIILNKTDSDYIFFDSANSLLGITVSILMLLAYKEYAVLMIPRSLMSIFLYISMIHNGNTEQITYLIYSIYSLMGAVKGFFMSDKLYKLQEAELK